MIISKSFDEWVNHPITTTIETLPISEVRFPKITVCPPKNTFTNLNYFHLLSRKLGLDAGSSALSLPEMLFRTWGGR